MAKCTAIYKPNLGAVRLYKKTILTSSKITVEGICQLHAHNLRHRYNVLPPQTTNANTAIIDVGTGDRFAAWSARDGLEVLRKSVSGVA